MAASFLLRVSRDSSMDVTRTVAAVVAVATVIVGGRRRVIAAAAEKKRHCTARGGRMWASCRRSPLHKNKATRRRVKESAG